MSGTSYATLLDTYKAKKDILERTRQKEQDSMIAGKQGQNQSYMCFLEKQAERANLAF